MLCTMRDYPGDLVTHLDSFLVLLRHVERPACFERAARDLAVDRSVLRRRIQALTSWVGAPLLIGRGAGARPTAAGRRLAERASEILASVRALPGDVAAARARISLACTGTITTELLPGVLVALERRTPPVDLSIRRAGSAAAERLVRQGDVDLGVVRAATPPRGLASEHLSDDRLLWVVPASRSASRARAGGADATLEAMSAVPLVLYGESSRTRGRVLERLAPYGATVRVEVDGKAAALEYVRAGLGATFLSLLPGHRLRDIGSGLVIKDVTSRFGPSSFYVIGRRDTWKGPVVADVVARLVRASRPKTAVTRP